MLERQGTPSVYRPHGDRTHTRRRAVNAQCPQRDPDTAVTRVHDREAEIAGLEVEGLFIPEVHFAIHGACDVVRDVPEDWLELSDGDGRYPVPSVDSLPQGSHFRWAVGVNEKPTGDGMPTTGREARKRDSSSALFVSDLDFTLLGSHAALSSRTIQVVNALVSQGVRFTYATARSHQSASRATKGLRLKLPVITYGGIMTMDPVSGVPEVVRSMPADAVATILRLTDDEPGVQPLVHRFSNGRDTVSWRSGTVTPGITHFLDRRKGDPRLAEVNSWSGLDLATAYYVSFIGRWEEVAAIHSRLLAKLEGCMLILSEDPYVPGVHWLEVHSEGGSKASAARQLAERLGMTRLVVFGDNHNDIPLFQAADESYAVSPTPYLNCGALLRE